MIKEIIICSSIVILVFVFNFLTENFTKDTIETINSKLENLKEELINEEINQNNVKKSIDDIKNIWKEKYETLAFYIEHDELEKVETELTTLSSIIDIDEYDDGVESIDKCIFILNHIKNKYTLEIKNIF